jgi:capsular exopolysaccharide synthesis family protein
MDHQTPGIDARYLLSVLVNGKWIIAATVALAVTLASVSNYFQAQRFQSSAQIQIDAPAFLPNPGADLVAQSNYYLNIDRYFKTEKEKISSHRMHLLFAEGIRQKDSLFQRQSLEAIATELAGMRVESVEDTNLVTVTLVSDDAQKAADWLNRYLDFFVQENARLQGENVRQNREILRKQLEEIKSLLSSQQEQASQADDSIGRTETEGGGEFIFSYQQAHEEARRKLSEEEQKLAKLEPFLSSDTDLTKLPTYDFLPGLKIYYDRFVEANTQLDKLRREGKGDMHPTVVAKRAEAQTIEEQLRAELKKSADALRLNVSGLQTSVANAGRRYNEKVAERRALNRQAQETERLNRLRDSWTNASALVEDKLRSLKVIESFVSNNISIVERAEINPYPVGRRGRGFVILAGIAGFFLGSILVLGGDFLNPKIKTVEEVNSDLGVNALGFLPRESTLTLHQIRESYNALRTELLFRRDKQRHLTIMITSSLPQEGKTTVALNLAKTLSEAGDRTIVVDFDLRKARLRSLMSRGNRNGDSVFSPVADLNLRLEDTDVDALKILVPVELPKRPPFVLSQPEIRALVDQLRSQYDWVLIDTPPVASVTDPVIIASLVDTVLFVIKHDFADKKVIKNSIISLIKVKADIMGAIINDLDVRKMNYHSYQNYYRYDVESESR